MNAVAATMEGVTAPEPSTSFAGAKRTRRVDVVSDDDDAQLMLAYARGEMRAFETLYARHRGALYRYLVRQSRDTEIAHDLFQEVWSRVIVNRARYEARAKFRTFLFTLAHNCFIDHCRRVKARPMLMGVDDADAADMLPADEEALPEMEIERDEVSRRYRAALATLPPEQRDVYLLHEESELSLEEIARVTGVGHRNRQEPVALRGRQAQGGHDSGGRRDMTGPDGEFDDFLTRRKPVFRRPENDPLEPPPELDRIVLRRAREAIEADQSEPAYHGTRWGMPVALAATLLVVFSVFLHLGVQSNEPVGEVSVQTVAQQVDYPRARRAPAPEVADIGPRSDARDRTGASPGFVTESEASRYSPPPPPPPVVAGADTGRSCGVQPAVVVTSAPPPSEAERAVAGPRPRRPGGAMRVPGWRKSTRCAPKARSPRPMPKWPNTSASTGRTQGPPTDRQPSSRQASRLLESGPFFSPGIFGAMGAGLDETCSQCRHHRGRRPDRLRTRLPCRLRPDAGRRHAREPAPARGHTGPAAALGRGDGTQ